MSSAVTVGPFAPNQNAIAAAIASANDAFDDSDADTAGYIADTLDMGMTQGMNPLQLANYLTFLVGPQRAEGIARNEMLGGYRDAANSVYRDNSDVVSGWMWSAASGACIACSEEDGTIHDLDEDMDGETHYACRCSPIPVTAPWSDILGPLGIDVSDIEETSIVDDYVPMSETFFQRSFEQQAEALGSKSAAEAVSRGLLEPSDFVGHIEGGPYDGALYTKSLKEVLADKGMSQTEIASLKRDLLAAVREGGETEAATAATEAAATAAESAEAVALHISDDLRNSLNTLAGRDLSDREIAALSGARAGDTVEVGGQAGSFFRFDVTGKMIGEGEDARASYVADRVLHVDSTTGELTMYNAGVEVDPALQGQGIGLELFSNQVQAARELGVTEITTSADGYGPAYDLRKYGETFEGEKNGYYTWARLGYNAMVPWEDMFVAGLTDADIPEELRGARTLQSLMRRDGGPQFWKAWGKPYDGTFSLKDGSVSMRVLDAYKEEKAAAGAASAVVESVSRVPLGPLSNVTATYDLTAADQAFAQALKSDIAQLDQATLTADQVSAIGQQLDSRIEADLTGLHTAADEASSISGRLANGPSNLTAAERAWITDDPAAVAAHNGVSYLDAQAQYTAEYQARVRAYLEEIRPMGGVDIALANPATAIDYNAEVADIIAQARENIPRNWLEASNSFAGDITPTRVAGGQVGRAGGFLGRSNGDARLSLLMRSNVNPIELSSTALHEMMHRMEQVFPQIGDLERAFYEARTAGESPVLMRFAAGRTLLDQWRDEYLGRLAIELHRPPYTIPGVTLPSGFQLGATTASEAWSYELLSVGAQMLLGGGSEEYDFVALRGDPDYFAFILGIFAALEGIAP